MSGDRRPLGGWMLPAIVVAVGACVLIGGMQRGALKPIALTPLNWVGLALMVAGAVLAVGAQKSRLVKLAGVAICAVGAMLVFIG